MNKITRNSLVLIFSQIAGKIVAFVFIVFIARFLGSQEFGKYSFIVAFIMIPNIVVNFGIDRLLIREVTRDRTRFSIYLTNTLLVKFVFSVLMVGLIYLLISRTNVFQDPVKSVCMIIFSLTIIFNPMQQTLWAVGDAYEEMQYHSILFVLWNLLRSGIGLTVLFSGYGLTTLFKGLLGAEVLNTVLTFVLIIKRFGMPECAVDLKFCLNLIKSAVPLALIQIFSTFWFRIDTIMLSVMRGDMVVGWYNAAHNLILTLLFIPSSITNAVFPHFSQLFGSSTKLLKESYDKSFKYLFIMGLPIAVGTTILARRIILSFYGREYMNSVVILQILVWALAVVFINCLLGGTLLAINREKQVAVILGAGALINFILNYLLISKMSYRGAALAKVASEVFVSIACLFILLKFFSSSPVPKVYQQPVLASVIMGVFIIKFNFIPLIPLILLACAVYVSVLFLTGTFKYDKIIKR
jgi:O-antigen/teichoic acid export membrane protein